MTLISAYIDGGNVLGVNVRIPLQSTMLSSVYSGNESCLLLVS